MYVLLKQNKVYEKMTPKECFNTQGFPESFVPTRYCGWSVYIKQAGNSVCVSVVQRIAVTNVSSNEIGVIKCENY